MGRRAKTALLVGAGLALAAFAPPSGPRLGYALDGLMETAALSPPVQPGEQYPPAGQDRTIATVPQPAPAARARNPDWTLSVDASVTADSNVTNSTDAKTVLVDDGSGLLPVPLDPNLRQRGGLGYGVSAAGSVKLPVAPGLAVDLAADGYYLDYPGRTADDSSVTASVGLDLDRGKSQASLQLIAFDRWYAGISAMAGGGVRANYRQEVGKGQHLALYLDARVFESDYGEPFGGKQANAYLAYDIVLDPTLTASGGVYVRRDWLRDNGFSSTEIGAYGNLTRYLGPNFTGGISLGASRALFDAPVAFLSPDPRRDWRYYASLYVTTRHPVLWGVTPSLTYTWNRTSSSILYYRADRHRLRLGLQRSF
ncbi:MAG: outer membrane protein [Sphingomonadales bacterium]|jgi:hypothetical protein|nr:outer membrane protein [Sphingomonadales bacterium]